MEDLVMAGSATQRGFWRGRRVFLTGHTGFKGTWLSLWLQSMGAEVSGYALAPPSSPNMFETLRMAEGMRSTIADITDLAALRQAMQAASPEVVLHLAAQALVRHSYDDPIGTYATNVLGTAHLLEAVRQTQSVRAVINVTTDKCYENREWQWAYRENDTLGGYDPYSNSKACSELVTAGYRSSFFNPAQFDRHRVALASARAGNVIGGGDWAADRLIPDMMRALDAGVPVRIRNPHAIRPWQHVLEPLSGYLTLAQALMEKGPEFCEAWNFGPDEKDAKTVGWIVEHLSGLWGEGASWEKDAGTHPHEATYLKLDTAKARSRLQWSPRWSLQQALQQIVNWHKAHRAGQDMRDITLQQIAAYEALSKPDTESFPT